MKKVFIIHGLGGRPNGGWRPWLMTELAKNDIYACAIPLPDPENPRKEAWLGELNRVVTMNGSDELYLVGHSLGVAAILRFLERWEGDRPIAGAVLAAGPSRITDNEKTREFLAEPFRYDLIRRKIGKAVIIHGDSDEVVPPEHARTHAEGLGAPLVMVEGARHLNGSSGCFELPECLEALLEMMG